jgi:arginyl-tRNA synthetase
VTPAELSATVLAAIRSTVDAGELALPADVLASLEVVVERPKNRDHGDYATNVALQLAKPAGRPPRAVAELIAPKLAAWPGSSRRRSPGPGSST